MSISARVSIMPIAMVKTIAASTLRGRYSSGPVRNSSTATTTTAVASCAICVVAPARSPIADCVGLPLTTNAPESAAAAFAADRPRMSAFSSTRSWCRVAIARAVAALCAMMMRKHDPATGISVTTSVHVATGSASAGSPPSIGPRVAMPRPAKSNAPLAAIAATTAMSGTGSRGSQRRHARMAPMTAAESASVGTCAAPGCRTISKRRGTVRWLRVSTPMRSPSTAMPT